MNYDYSKRGFLLPEGCKDLIDVLKLADQSKQQQPVLPPPLLPPIIGQMEVPDQIAVRELAALVNQKPFQIIADLMGLGIFANVNQQLDFGTVSRVLRKYGYAAKRTA